MTENNSTTSKPPQGAAANSDDRDWFLCQLVRFADSGVGIGITLTVGGATITGTLSSGAAYFKEVGGAMQQPLSDAFNPAIGEQFYRTLAAHAKTFEAAPDKGEEAAKIQYLHVKNAKFVAPGQPMTPQGAHWWRGRVDQVDGFMIGEISGT